MKHQLPLRWESTGEQWWFASPIDLAASHGHYELVKELLHMDPNLVIKLTSLHRIRRLETLWDDEDDVDKSGIDMAKCRCEVAKKLLQECGYNCLIGAGYGGWLLYSAASAGDLVFVKEILQKEPALPLGEAGYGVTDILYGAARSKDCEVFRLVFDCCKSDSNEVSMSDMVNRAVHAAARGGNVDMVRELAAASVLDYRDAFGSTLLHSAAANAQLQVVMFLISSYDIIDTVDKRGNTALHVAAYNGHLAVLKALISASPSSASLKNIYGDTFLHMAVSGFSAPSFKRLDKQIQLMQQIVGGSFINLHNIINATNNDGRTALHMALFDTIQSEVIHLLISVPGIDLNIQDNDGCTPLDLLKQQPPSASSQILIKRLISAGGVFRTARKPPLASHLKMRGGAVEVSPGTSFRIPDSEIILHAGAGAGVESTNIIESEKSTFEHRRSSSATRRLKILLHWPRISKESEENSCIKSGRMWSSSNNSPMPLRQQFSRLSNKRILSVQGNLPSPSPYTKKKFGAGFRQVLPKSNLGSPMSAYSESSWSSCDNKRRSMYVNSCGGSPGPSSLSQSPTIGRKQSSLILRSMNNYFCLGAGGPAVDNSIGSQPQCSNQQSIVV